jgi:2-(1,2-epoxy-1,2-dihydrophenyl)acetyl-CoA isomerase
MTQGPSSVATYGPPLIEERAGAVAIVRMNRPRAKNALNRELVTGLGQSLQRAAFDTTIRVIVLTGNGGAFCSGVDLNEAAQDIRKSESVAERIDGFHTIVRTIVGAPKPVIAAVNGGAVGFGCDLALACDLRVLAEDAYLQEKFVSVGLMPDGGGTFHLPRLVGMGRALELLMLGERVDAKTAREIGLATRVTPSENVLNEALTLADKLSKGPPLALASIKHAARAALSGDFESALQRERVGQMRLLSSKDALEGVLAFLQKREPKFKGQ